MKSSSETLSESIGTIRAYGETKSITTGIAAGVSDDRGEHLEDVRVSITSSSGFEDAESFTFRSRKAANAFARQVMSASLRSYERRDADVD